MYDFKRKFDWFEDLEEMDTQIKMLEWKQKQGKNKQKTLAKLQTKRNKLHDKLISMNLKPTAISYIIHFKTIQYKMNFIQELEKYNSIDEAYYNFVKAMCCSGNKIPSNLKFEGKHFPVLKERKFGRPEDIRWENLDIGNGEKCCRFVVGIIMILLVLAAASLTIAVCSIYVSITNDCSYFNSATTLA